MRQAGEESEVKFLIRNCQTLEARLVASGAVIVQAKTRELNLRFDTAGRTLTQSGRVLRLRKDQECRLTYKDSGLREAGYLRRREIEFSVSDFDEARNLLLALGYQVVFSYEKYRTTYAHEGVEFMLDELPYGNFVEVEGPGSELQAAAEALGLNWEAAIPRSYHDLFQDVCRKLELTLCDLTFDSFSRIRVTPEDLGVKIADGR